MACERYRKALSELAAGASAPGELDAHIAGCAGCRAELAALRRALEAVDADLGEIAGAEPAPALAARIRQAAAEAEIGSAWRPAFLLPSLAAAVLAAVTLVLFRGHESPKAPVARLTPRAPLASEAPLPPPAVSASGMAPGGASTAPPVVARVPESASARRSGPAEPEVLVPPGQVEPLLRFAALVNRDRVASPSLAAVEQASSELAEPRPIDVRSVDIEPLEIVPLDAAEETGT
jgi:hypothetical protein